MPRKKVGLPVQERTKEVIQSAKFWEQDGVSYSPGDTIRISGVSGSFTFWSHDTNTQTGAQWLTVMWVGRSFRHFHLDRVLPPKKAKQGRSLRGVPALCDTHRQYTAQRKPRTDCKECWLAYESKKGTQDAATV